MTCVFFIDTDTIIWLFSCVDVGPHGHEVELLRAPDHQDPGRPPREGLRVGERRQCEGAEARPAEDERVARRCRFHDPGIGPSHSPLVDVGANFENICCLLEEVLQGMPEGMWFHIQDEDIME
jgi:hypothetical protein